MDHWMHRGRRSTMVEVASNTQRAGTPISDLDRRSVNSGEVISIIRHRRVIGVFWN
jgi:hypothetical protein